MCSFLKPVPSQAVPLNGYRRSWTTSDISEDNFQRLGARRAAVLEEVSRRLSRFVPIKEKELPEDEFEIYMMIVIELNGREALPSLIELESALQDHPLASDVYRYTPQVQILSVRTALLLREDVHSLDSLEKVTLNRRDGYNLLEVEFNQTTRGQILDTVKSLSPPGVLRP